MGISLYDDAINRLRGAWKVVELTISGEDSLRDEEDDDESAHFLWFTEAVSLEPR